MRIDVGSVLAGRYQLRNQIAVGGMGEVWAAHDTSLSRDVAIKVLREEYAGDQAFLARLRTEARNAARLSHHNIAQLYDYQEIDGRGFLIMELVAGQALSDLLEHTPVLPAQRLLPILAQTARALHAAHVAGIVHRDVKPGNILLSRSGRVKITDFGISTAGGQSSHTAPGMVMGTAQYLSPEQATGKPATASSDIYALGVIAFEALAGHRPFTGATPLDIAVAHVNEPVPALPPKVDARLAALVARMLAKDPAERPRTAADLAHQLDALVVSTPASGIPAVPSPRTAASAASAATRSAPPQPAARPAPAAPAPRAAVATIDPPSFAPDPTVAPPSSRPVIVGRRPQVAPPTYTPPARHAERDIERRPAPLRRVVATSSAARQALLDRARRQRLARLVALGVLAVLCILLGVLIGSHVFAVPSATGAALGTVFISTNHYGEGGSTLEGIMREL